LRHSLYAGGAVMVGCGGEGGPRSLDSGPFDGGMGDAPMPDVLDAGMGCPDAFRGGELIDVVPFINDGGVPLDTPLNVGWDGRLYTDLSTLTQESLVVANERFYIRTRYPDRLDPSAPWRVSVHGLVDDPRELSLEELTPMVRPMGVHLLECSGNGRGGAFGLMSAADWSGVPLREVLDMFSLQSGATRVLVSGFDDHSVPSAGGHSRPGASWVFSLDEVDTTGMFLATHMNGEELPADHGFPLRLFVPGWYGCSCIKWVNEIVLVDEDQPSTSQMIEFASRTHQIGEPALARDYQPASIDQAAMPIRIEKWRVDGRPLYRVVGVMWGGYELTEALVMRFEGGGDFFPVDVCPAQMDNATWTLWSTPWQPTTVGDYDLACQIDDPTIPTRRLDRAFYLRQVAIDDV
jgi:DMSO/TMAO reductase YedYZ molybdopterin-dependent catalytic subunit